MDDIKLPGMLHAVVLRSPHAHAGIRGIDKRAALALPGVRAVFTFADLPPSMQRQTVPLLVPSPAIKQAYMPYCLARDEACFVGEPIAIVVADSRYLAEDAAALVAIDFEPLPAASDCVAALAPGAPLAHRDAHLESRRRHPGQCRQRRCRLRAGRACVSRADFPASRRAVLSGVPRHDRGAGSDGGRAHHLRLLAGPAPAQAGALDLLDWADHQLRIVTPDVGGGFGPKGSFYAEYGALAAAALKLRAPIKWIEDRHENFLSTQQERDQYWDMEIAVDDDARILGVRGKLTHEAGAYMPWGVVLPWIAATSVPGPYVIPSFHLDVAVAFTNKVPTSPVRGAGRPQACVVMERLMDRVAREMKLDRAEVRRRNFIQPSQMPYKVGIIFRDGRPVTYDSGDYPTCQQKALEGADYDGFRGPPGAGAPRGPLYRDRHRQCGGGDRARPLRERDRPGVDQRQAHRLYRRHPAGPVAQDHARPDRRRSSRRARPTRSPS